MQILLGPFSEGSSLRIAEVKAMLMSVRFSTPLNLDTFGKLLSIALPEDYIGRGGSSTDTPLRGILSVGRFCGVPQ